MLECLSVLCSVSRAHMTAFYNVLNDRIVSFFILTEVILNINKFIQNYFNHKGTICFIEITLKYLVFYIMKSGDINYLVASLFCKMQL